MAMYSVSHFVWFSNNDSTLCTKQSIISLQTTIATDTCPAAPVMWAAWRDLNSSTLWLLQRHSFSKSNCATHLVAEWPLAGTWPFPLWCHFSCGLLCARTQAWISGMTVKIGLWIDTTSGNRNILLGIAQIPQHLPQLCLPSWAKEHRYQVISCTSLLVLLPRQSKFV